MNEDAFLDWLESFAIYLVNVGLVWFFVWFLNPNIDSGLVWLIAILFGTLMGRFYVIEKSLK